MNEQQLQQAFLQFLAQKTGAKTEAELKQVIQQLGEQGIQEAYQEFMQYMQQAQQQQVQAAKHGAKIAYIKQLRGICPDGFEMKYYKAGGQLCKKCMKKAQEGGNMPSGDNAIDQFKKGRKMKKDCGGSKLKFAENGSKLHSATSQFEKTHMPMFAQFGK